MKGLIRNNFYTVEGSLKATLLLSFVAAIVLAIVVRFNSDNGPLLTGIIGGNLGGFGALAMTVMQKDATSKWNKFELTMPVRRRDVITARYISSLLYVLIGAAMALLSVMAFYLATGVLNPERMIYGFVFGFGFALSISTFMFPLLLLFGADKTETMMLISVMASLGLFFGASAIATPILIDFENANLVFRVSYVAFCIVLFGVSYLLSCWIYKKKEL